MSKENKHRALVSISFTVHQIAQLFLFSGLAFWGKKSLAATDISASVSSWAENLFTAKFRGYWLLSSLHLYRSTFTSFAYLHTHFTNSIVRVASDLYLCFYCIISFRFVYWFCTSSVRYINLLTQLLCVNRELISFFTARLVGSWFTQYFTFSFYFFCVSVYDFIVNK